MSEREDNVLLQAIVEGRVSDAVELLASHPEWRESPLPFDQTWLHIAAGEPFEAMVLALLEVGFEPNATGDDGATPLFAACHNGHLENVSVLLAHGADISAADENNATPLVAACISGHLPVVKLLVDRGAKLDVLYGRKKKTAVMAAREFGHTEIADYLLNLGAPEFTPEGVEIPEDEEDEINHHVEDHWGPVDEMALTEIVGGLRIMVVRPNEDDNRLTLISNGISEMALNVPPGAEEFQYAELVMHLPGNWPLDDEMLSQSRYSWPITLFRSIAHLPEQMDTWYGDAPLIVDAGNPPQPYDASVPFTSTLLLRDTSMPPLQQSDGKLVRFYTLCPLHPDEREFEARHGWQALGERFQAKGFDPVADPARPSVLSRLS